MSEDRQISEGLRRLGGQDWQPPEFGPAAAVRTARRRAGVQVAGLVTAVAAVALAVPVALSQGPVAAPAPPAVGTVVIPSPSVAAPVPTPSAPPPAPTPEVTAVTEPSQPPSTPVVGPGPLRLVAKEESTGPLSGGTLTGLRVRDVEPGSDALAGAESGVSSSTSWLVDPCGDGPPASDEARTGFYSAFVPGDVAPVYEAATYPDAATAARVVQEVADEVVRCRSGSGTVWRLWDGSGPEGEVDVVSYDVSGAVAEGGTATPQYGQVFRVASNGTTVVVTGFGSMYRGTGIAYALKDTRPEVGPADWGLTREAVQEQVDTVTSSWAELRWQVAAHLADVGQEAGSGGGFPALAVPVHGGRAWAVFVAVARDVGDERLDQAVEDLAAVGYETGVSEVGCFQGAAEALGLDPARSYLGVSVEFASAAEAEQMVEAFEPGVVGTAEVVTSCLD